MGAWMTSELTPHDHRTPMNQPTDRPTDRPSEIFVHYQQLMRSPVPRPECLLSLSLVFNFVDEYRSLNLRRGRPEGMDLSEDLQQHDVNRAEVNSIQL